jgi:hypothetical protein
MCKYCIDATKENPEILQVNTTVQENWDKYNFNGGYVYFFTNKDLSLVKIGYSKNDPYSRMKMYEYELCQKYTMVAVWPVIYKETEKQIHKYFNAFRVRREFFEYNHHICGFLKGLWMTFSCGMNFQDISALWGLQGYQAIKNDINNLNGDENATNKDRRPQYNTDGRIQGDIRNNGSPRG